MKYYLGIITSIFFVISFLSIPSVVYAHFPKTDGSITATLHIDPNDDPVPAEQAHLYFLFSDTAKKFQLTKCNCIVSISEEGKQIFQQLLVEKKEKQPSIWGASMPFTFPKRDVYQITITGKPIQPDSFQPFTLSWDFRVDETNVLGASSQEPSSDPTFIYFALFFVSIPILGGLSIFLLIKKSEQS